MLSLPPEPAQEDQVVHAQRANYYCLAYCEKHGYLKGKIRIRKSDEGGTYVVKTTKLIDEKDAEALKKRRDRAKEFHKRYEGKLS